MIHTITIQPFNCPVTVATTREAYCDFFPMTHADIAGCDALCQEFSDKDGNTGFGLLLLKRWDSEIVHHECLHLVHMVMEAHGLAVDGGRSSSEMQCYLQTHIVKQVKEVCYAKKKPQKKKAKA